MDAPGALTQGGPRWSPGNVPESIEIPTCSQDPPKPPKCHPRYPKTSPNPLKSSPKAHKSMPKSIKNLRKKELEAYPKTPTKNKKKHVFLMFRILFYMHSAAEGHRFSEIQVSQSRALFLVLPGVFHGLHFGSLWAPF